MSLQRIFESARKLGVPVILTDPAGREPMVVLTLEQFEAIAGTTEAQSEPTQTSVRRGRPSSRRPAEAPKGEDFMFPVEDIGSRPAATEPSIEDFSSQAPSGAEISLDERFYLEPLEDEKAA
jgi:hypothetical protein